MAYNQDTLMWFVKDMGGCLEKVSIERLNKRRYFSLGWMWSDYRVCFAFEGGDHWKRWQSIADETLRMPQTRGERGFRFFVFRTPDLARVPRPSWVAAKATMDEAKKRGFGIVDLTLDQVCQIHAARELYSNALQGNIAYGGPETLAWLRGWFAPFLNQLAFGGSPAKGRVEDDGKKPTIVLPTDASKPQIEAAKSIELDDEKLRIMLDMVREQRIIDISVVLGRLGNSDLRDPLLRSVEAHPNLKAHPGPRTIFLQWRITP
jgi:hypothetical protein